MPENAKWRMRWAKKVVVECEQFDLAQRPHTNVHIQICSFVSHYGTNIQRHVQVGVIAQDQSASDIACLITKAI